MSLATTHKNYAHTWWTPKRWMDWALETLGPTTFDPYPRDWHPDCGWDALTGDLPEAPGYWNHPGARSSVKKHWPRFLAHAKRFGGIWCAFNCEQIRHTRPNLMLEPGYLVQPLERVGFVWGGPDIPELKRKHGGEAASPGNWTVFWSTVEPATPPDACIVTPTGVGTEYTKKGGTHVHTLGD